MLKFDEEKQIASVQGALALRPRIEEVVDGICKAGFTNICWLGIGGTYASCLQAEVHMRERSRLNFYVLNAAEYLTTGDLRVGEGTIVVVSSDRMGSGNDELGKVLMKGFLFAITQLDVLPRKMLFYNGGATLTAKGSDPLEHLKPLEAQGVEILTCGTCLDYYQLKDKLAVGTVTNMYSIVEAMAEAGKIIRP